MLSNGKYVRRTPENMHEGNRDHIALILPISGTDSQQTTSRKSCRRYWNQLPRCQKNPIILTLTAACVTLLFFIPSKQITENADNRDHINIAPFKEEHSNVLQRDVFPRENHKKILEITSETAKLNFQVDQTMNQIEPEISNSVDELKDDKVKQFTGSNIGIIGADDLLNKIEESGDKMPKDFKGPSNERQRAVVDAFKHSWKNYKEFAWGHDHLRPISMSSHDWFGLGLSIVDSLDTMYIMDLQEEFEEARNWVDSYLHFDINREVNLFEVTIRILGGLLSAHHLSGDKMFLKKSIDLGNRLLPCFESPSGIPYSDVNLSSMVAHSPKWSLDSSTSEVATIQLEFRDLSRTSGNPIYEQVAQSVSEKIHALEKPNGLVPIFINPNTGEFRNSATISLGARGDSYYEYLLKQWIQKGARDDSYYEYLLRQRTDTGRKVENFLILDYLEAIEGVLKQLVKKTPREQLTFVGELINGKIFKPKMDHLTCYLPGTLLLGYKFGMPEKHLNLAKELLDTCYQMYMKQPTKLAPEITYFNMQNDGESDIQVKPNDAHNLLRPEFIESLYYFYAITGNRTYQDMGWEIFQAFEKYTKVKHGYTSINNVKNVLNTHPRDMMESFWLSETLKYFYLLFSDDRKEIDLDKYVFNTEAHPLPIRT